MENKDSNLIAHQISTLTSVLQVAHAIGDSKLKKEVADKISDLIKQL